MTHECESDLYAVILLTVHDLHVNMVMSHAYLLWNMYLFLYYAFQ